MRLRAVHGDRKVESLLRGLFTLEYKKTPPLS